MWFKKHKDYVITIKEYGITIQCLVRVLDPPQQLIMIGNSSQVRVVHNVSSIEPASLPTDVYVEDVIKTIADQSAISRRCP